MTLSEDAVKYVELGWTVFPCQPRSKEPVLRHGFKEATRDATAVREWWSQMPQANIGVACGSSELVVVDVDAPEGPEAWRRLCEELEIDVLTPSSYTPNGGRHIFFVAPCNGLPGGGIVKNSTRRLGPGLDIRADGGYVVAPPSVHPNGGVYRWEPGRSPFDVGVASMPASLARRLAALSGQEDVQAAPAPPHPPASRRRGEVRGGEVRRYALVALRREADAVRRTAPGGRNNRLNRAAFALSRFVRAGALSAGEVENELGCAAIDAGLEQREVAATVRSGFSAGIEKTSPPSPLSCCGRREGVGPAPRRCGTAPPATPPLPAFPLTDAGNGELIAALYGEELRYNHDRSAWLIWDGARWQADRLEKVRTLAVEAARIRGDDALTIAEPEHCKAVADFARRSENGGRLNEALKCARTLEPVAISTNRLDADPWLLGCPNGTVNLRTGELGPGRPEDLISLSTATPFDPAATAPRWERFLMEICLGDDELVGYLRRAAGYSLTGVTTEQVFFVCLGSGANGKSTFVNALHAAFGEYATQAAAGCFEIARFSEGMLNDIAMLVGKRFVTAGETARNKTLHEQRIKQMTGGDLLTARFLYGEFFTFRPSMKIWMPTNYRPAIAGTDEGIWRRVREIPFKARFTGSAEKDLGETLASELPGILAWAVRGCLEWQEVGLAEPDCVKEASERYRVECDPLRRFLAECVERAPGARVPASQLYDRYRRWCAEEEAAGVLSQKRFGTALGEMGYDKVHTRTGSAFEDMSLIQEA